MISTLLAWAAIQEDPTVLAWRFKAGDRWTATWEYQVTEKNSERIVSFADPDSEETREIKVEWKALEDSGEDGKGVWEGTILSATLKRSTEHFRAEVKYKSGETPSESCVIKTEDAFLKLIAEEDSTRWIESVKTAVTSVHRLEFNGTFGNRIEAEGKENAFDDATLLPMFPKEGLNIGDTLEEGHFGSGFRHTRMVPLKLTGVTKKEATLKATHDGEIELGCGVSGKGSDKVKMTHRGKIDRLVVFSLDGYVRSLQLKYEELDRHDAPDEFFPKHDTLEIKEEWAFKRQ